jgi:hypothetical protein
MEIPDNAFESVEDFLESKRFQNWVRGKAPEDALFWKELLHQHPDKTPFYEKAVAIMLVISGKNAPDISASIQAEQIREALAQQKPNGKHFPILQWLRWGVAAMLVMSIGLWWQRANQDRAMLNTDKSQRSLALNRSVTMRNPDRKTMLINLPDGSSVLLSKGSSISFKTKMNGQERVVNLVGEGFFEVVKDARRPFVVYADKLVTKVVGTSFRMKSFPESNEAFVVVKTGKVMVSKSSKNHIGDQAAVTLLPNQQMQLLVKNNKLTTQISEAKPTAQMNTMDLEEFNFRFTPITEAFKVLESNYAVHFRYDAEKMRNCTLTASLKDEPFLDKLRLICLATETTYRVEGDQILISGAGCP